MGEVEQGEVEGGPARQRRAVGLSAAGEGKEARESRSGSSWSTERRERPPCGRACLTLVSSAGSVWGGVGWGSTQTLDILK